ncbi:ImmA/IrrE family metallo-endopeptidase [Iningainema tapete]|uniref:ImmA/IrrE family metallo-endopeptidase n=1 Tax=Iningainema tapete BLCC-T55 TaxID=2748662 RepID=A0A8J6XFT8_9CYAN|nr:ImmA/IrrE family metallo-endopeptidase [Iningainema tapete]MBD2772255.1 ImmA/IrrE family metallo-endopeptidase [Iningainema tapete BLCC-T55]
MTRNKYYEEMKELARQIRGEHGLTTPQVRKSDIRRIYKAYNIKCDLWPLKDAPPTVKFKKLRGTFFYDECGATIMVNRSLPEAPALFTMCHELKHYLVDRDLRSLVCADYNQTEEIEVGAEVFAAEMLFPDEDFINGLVQMGVKEGECTAEDLVRLKHAMQATISYAGMEKKAEFLGFVSYGSLKNVKWTKLEEQMYGVPVYKQFQRQRKQAKELTR